MIQVQFINKVLDTRDSNVIINHNITEDFFPVCHDEFVFIKEHITNYGHVPDKETFFGKFPNFDLLNVTEDMQFLIQELFNDRNANIITHHYNIVRDKVKAGKVNEAISELHTTVDFLATSTPVKADDYCQNAQQRYEDYVNKGMSFDDYYVKTGFPELDNLIGGWDRKEELVTIAARTNVGKTWIMIKSLCESMMQGLRVGLYEGEMSAEKVYYRVDTMISHLSNKGLTHGDMTIQSAYKEYIDETTLNSQGYFLKTLTPKDIGGFATVSQLRAFIEMYNLDILFVDQHSLLEDERKGKSPVEKASNISKDLRSLQALKKIPIITVSQQNRTATDNGVGTEHIAQSDRIAQDSTIIIFVEANKEQSMLTLNLTKSRDSANMKKLNYIHDFDKGTFKYVPDEQFEGDNSDRERTEALRDEYVITPDEISPF